MELDAEDRNAQEEFYTSLKKNHEFCGLLFGIAVVIITLCSIFLLCINV